MYSVVDSRKHPKKQVSYDNKCCAERHAERACVVFVCMLHAVHSAFCTPHRPGLWPVRVVFLFVHVFACIFACISIPADSQCIRHRPLGTECTFACLLNALPFPLVCFVNASKRQTQCETGFLFALATAHRLFSISHNSSARPSSALASQTADRNGKIGPWLIIVRQAIPRPWPVTGIARSKPCEAVPEAVVFRGTARRPRDRRTWKNVRKAGPGRLRVAMRPRCLLLSPMDRQDKPAGAPIGRCLLGRLRYFGWTLSFSLCTCAATSAPPE